LEIFFGGIRLKNGRNHNPTAKQFVRAFKGMLMNVELKIDNANVMDSSIPILNGRFEKKGKLFITYKII
jgi:hypothetical protein